VQDHSNKTDRGLSAFGALYSLVRKIRMVSVIPEKATQYFDWIRFMESIYVDHSRKL
jgi:hypothetical protein